MGVKLRHDCNLLGHVLVGDDPECLVCGMPTVKGSKIRMRLPEDRSSGDLTDPRGIAAIDGPDSWGHADTGQPSAP